MARNGLSETMSVASPYVVATLVGREDGRPNWATYPVDGIHIVAETQTLYPATLDSRGNLPQLDPNNLPPVGNPRHSGLSIAASKRIPTHLKGTTQFNLHMASVVLDTGVRKIVDTFNLSLSDAAPILEDRLPENDTTERLLDGYRNDSQLATAVLIGHCLGANLVVAGINNLTIGHEVGPYDIETETEEPTLVRNGSIYISGINRPCPMPGGLLARVYGLSNPQEAATRFEEEIFEDRGYVAAATEDGLFATESLLLAAPYRA